MGQLINLFVTDYNSALDLRSCDRTQNSEFPKHTGEYKRIIFIGRLNFEIVK